MSHPTDATNPELDTASERNEYQVTRDDLPLSCPTPAQKLWNSHPRVYLPIEETGKASCPYCGAHYVLTD